MSRRKWIARDVLLTSDPRMQVLGDEYGPAAPLAFEELVSLSKMDLDDGTVSTTYSALARRVFVTPAKAKRVVHALRDLELIELDEGPLGPKGFTAVIPAYRKWQRVDPKAAERQARRRAVKSRTGHA